MFCVLFIDAILEKIRESGFKVAMQKEMQLTREMAEDFYKEHEGQDYFEQLVTNMSRYTDFVFSNI
jgi:nucleoside diphosphate kinase